MLEGQHPETADGNSNLLFCYFSQICISFVSDANVEHIYRCLRRNVLGSPLVIAFGRWPALDKATQGLDFCKIGGPIGCCLKKQQIKLKF